MADANGADQRIFDVARPGKTAASAQSRPVIVGHRTLLQDPMMIKAEKSDAAENDKPKPEDASGALTSTGRTISPPDQAPPTPATDDSTVDQSSTTDTTQTSGPSDQTSVKKQAEKEQQAQTAKQENLHKLIEAKKYYVPIGEKKRTRSIRHLLLAIIAILLLAIVLGDLLIDAGIVKTSINPPVRIFHHNQ